jgi:uncharacterized repeat protein (TIGR03803 family)
MKQTYKLIGACFSAAILAACSGSDGFSSSTPTSVTPSLGSQPALGRYASHGIRKNVQTETVLYRFAGGTDGNNPIDRLLNVGGTLYGTTGSGGANGDGSVYSITPPSGTKTVLYNFAGGSDGAGPDGGLVNVGGTLYGTTTRGGTSSDGTVYSITTSGTETVLYSFQGGADGLEPLAGGLLNVSGTLYGTTVNGGGGSGCAGPGCGTVFKITTAGTYHHLYSFAGGSDGGNPYGGLIKVGSALYGTTAGGGGSGCLPSASGCGTVFKITTSGTHTVLHRFAGADGANPLTDLVKVGSKLYGTTEDGGGSGCYGGYGCGTIFKITTSGTESVVYSFVGGNDGIEPVTALTNVDGTLFGMTAAGGTANLGTIFALLANSGPEIVLYSFAGGSDGQSPSYGSLANVGGTLYGTTSSGGGSGCSGVGCGTVFSLSF